MSIDEQAGPWGPPVAGSFGGAWSQPAGADPAVVHVALDGARDEQRDEARDEPREGHTEAWPHGSGPGTFIPYDWSPPPLTPQAGPRAGRLLLAAAVLFAAATGALGYLAYHNDQMASGWKHLEEAKAAQVAQLTSQMRIADNRISTLNGQLATVNGQVSSLQQQLSSAADQKAKALDTENVLQQLLSSAGQVADDLQQCIMATNQFYSDLNGAFNGNGNGNGNGFTSIGALQAEGQQVDSTCNAAEAANSAFQKTIQNTP